MSLDEWKKSQNRDKPTFNLRKANDGETKFKGMKTLKKQSEDDLDAENSLFIPTHVSWFFFLRTFLLVASDKSAPCVEAIVDMLWNKCPRLK